MKQILYTSPHIPTEWIRAHGFLPVRIIPDGSEQGPFDLSEGICAYSKSFFNAIDSWENVAGIIVAGVCDQMRRGVDLMIDEIDIPLYLFHLPTTWQQDNARVIYEYEMRLISKFLCSLSGKIPDDKFLRVALCREENSRRNIQNSFTVLDYKSYRSNLNNYFTGRRNKSEKHVPLINNGQTKRIALLGGPLPDSQLSLIEIIESNGGKVVVDGSETGFRSWPEPLDASLLRENPFQALCDCWMRGIRSAFQRPNSSLYQWLDEEVRKWDVQGILYIRWIWCDLWHGEFERFRELLDIPIIPIDINGIDSSERNRTRVEAFCESIR